VSKRAILCVPQARMMFFSGKSRTSSAEPSEHDSRPQGQLRLLRAMMQRKHFPASQRSID